MVRVLPSRSVMMVWSLPAASRQVVDLEPSSYVQLMSPLASLEQLESAYASTGTSDRVRTRSFVFIMTSISVSAREHR